MSGHTPGPWASLGPTIYDRAIIKAGDYEAATQIAVTYGRKSGDEHDANTRLIAAAPDLLKALQATVDELIDAGFGASPYGLTKVSIGIELGLAAIAKAKGAA
jgi:hypothetical protein